MIARPHLQGARISKAHAMTFNMSISETRKIGFRNIGACAIETMKGY
ncbi:hypothetical protein C725_0691 [Pacificimonas flava]|uniref:Uncharacterized protein n=1 Tax=Pacificimonas flava TaxID=1234595 RepID=M2TAU3_9SPHN|nr:hypothetical protein C725_0691 [Pacificimonas flava]